MNTTIRAISPSETTKFIKSQWNFYKDDKMWVAPVIADRKKLLNIKKNPFFKHSDMQLFLAESDGKIVGRIAAIVNDNHNKVHDDKVGFFGFFECINDQTVADALFKSAGEWLLKKGMNAMRGPLNPSINDEAGLLVEGFHEPPFVLMTYNPPYYGQLIERAGLKKEKDLLAFIMNSEDYVSEKMRRMQDIIRQRFKLKFRQIDFKNKAQFQKDVATMRDIYNAAWEKNWGAVRMTDEEFDFLAADLKQIATPELTIILESEGKPMGFALALPDINQALKHNPSGSLLGAAWHLMIAKKPITQSRIIVLGVLPEYRGKGIDSVLYYEIGERSINKGMPRGEASWILEDNTMMIRGATTVMQGKHYKTYRVYQKEL
ncbi:MAG: GNAT family N-acetyltransferase [Bacteroidota bacterium]